MIVIIKDTIMFTEDEYGQAATCECDGCPYWPDCSGCAVNPIYAD